MFDWGFYKNKGARLLEEVNSLILGFFQVDLKFSAA